MFTIFCIVVLAAGIIATFHPHIHLGFLAELFTAIASISAGGYIMGGDTIAVLYCLMALLCGSIAYSLRQNKQRTYDQKLQKRIR